MWEEKSGGGGDCGRRRVRSGGDCGRKEVREEGVRDIENIKGINIRIYQ